MNITFEFACRDDCLENMVPSDLRKLVIERDYLLAEVERLREKNERLHTLLACIIQLMDSPNGAEAYTKATDALRGCNDTAALEQKHHMTSSEQSVMQDALFASAEEQKK